MALSDLFGKKAANKAAILMEETLKRGKSPDQCKCIDFFLQPEDAQKKGCLSKNKKVMTIDEYCQYLQNMVDKLNLKQKAIEKIGLDESQISEIPPIYLSSFQNSEFSKSNENYTKYVTDTYSVTWIFFSATQLYTYTYTFETTSDDVTEFTRDFFYSDITCIRTEHEIQEVIYEPKTNKKGCKGCLKTEKKTYLRTHRKYDTLQITVPNDSYSFCCTTNDTIEQSISAAKAMIREKKQA